MISKVCFVIAHRYVRGYKYYLHHYVENIRKFYVDYMIIIVDNNSVYKEEVLNVYKNDKDIIIIDNTSDSKFEAGAYNVGVKYILDNNISKKYNYYVFTQDTYILKNKFNFDELEKNEVLACPISYGVGTQDLPIHLIKPHIQNLNIWDDNIQYNTKPILELKDITSDILNKVLHCYCSVFIINEKKLNVLHNYLNKIKITTRNDSELFERYFAFVLFKLNNNKNYQIDFNPYSLYDRCSIDLLDEFNHGYFAKHQQGKRENVIDK